MSSWWGSSSTDKSSSSSAPPVSSFDDKYNSSSSNFDSDFSLPSSSNDINLPSSNLNASNTNSLQQALLEEQERMQVQQAVTKIADLCFVKCVTRPSDKLSGSEQKCVANCAERFLDTTMFITGRMMKQHGGGGAQ